MSSSSVIIISKADFAIQQPIEPQLIPTERINIKMALIWHWSDTDLSLVS
nr:MAG TPA: hypothetical protein [Caudoviricetes sp.]